MRNCLAAGALLVVALGLAAPQAAAGVRVGDFAQDFNVLNQWGEYTHLWDSLGDVIVVDMSAVW